MVFRRRDKWTGDTRYIYHGNDGTSFPWNDTAQLDYLNPAVREQVIQTILHVARLFPDHPLRRRDDAGQAPLPAPVVSGARGRRRHSIARRVQHDRGGVRRAHAGGVLARGGGSRRREVPGTLLLAEAFWLMEGYFVRTLGMHRVYNSAFMNHDARRGQRALSLGCSRTRWSSIRTS